MFNVACRVFIHTFFGLFVMITTALPGFASSESQGVENSASARCVALRNADFSRLADAVTEVASSTLTSSAADSLDYCEVQGYVAPSIKFRLRLPTSGWNGKIIELGCGGTCGTTEHILNCNGPLRRGYACIVSDGGNSSSGDDVKWAYNRPQAVIDYLVRASHVTAIAGKAITERYYNKLPQRSYFMGCSGGGLQAMSEAEWFPWDFDGIVAGDPDLSLSEDWMNLVWANRAFIGDGAASLLSQTDLEILHKAVVAKCDLNDGVKDGLIGDPRMCKFEPEELACTTDKKGGCLSTSQIEAVRKIYGGPITATGKELAMPHVFKGSELSWLEFFGGSNNEPTSMYKYTAEWFRYYLFQPNPGPTWTVKDFDFERDYQRFGLAELTEPVNADLRRLKNRNGKLLLYTGWNDPVAGVGRTVDYYESAEKIVGERARTQEFFRLFVVPGMNHCSGGDGPFAIDYLTYLETWVEKGVAPDKVIGSHVRLEDLIDEAGKGDQDAGRKIMRRLEFPLDPTTVEFSRPIYPYPTQTKYMGHGDPKLETSFGPALP
jgi:hypothetical protein